MAKYNKNKKIKFVNPYNFVSISNQKTERKNADNLYKNQEELYTGYLECRLFVKTPLAIPDLPLDSNEEHKKYPFFSIDGKPIIPGSSIRGTLRSVYETVTGSCFSTMRKNTKLSKRVEIRNAYKPGILVKEGDGWKLYSADKYLLPITGRGYRPLGELQGRQINYIAYNDNGERVIKDGDEDEDGQIFRYGDAVNIETYGIQHYKGEYLIWKDVISNISKAEQSDACLFIGEPFSMKHGEEIFVKENIKEGNTQLVQSAMEDLEESLKIYRNSSINKEYNTGKHSGYKGYENAKKRGIIPVWYDTEGEKLHLSMGAIGRTVFDKRLDDLIGDKVPCTKRECLCPACRLFGMTGENSLGSRIRITDAELESDLSLGKDYELKKVMIKELGMPRYSYLPFYGQHRKDYSKAINSYDDKDVEIRGRKYYWHNPACIKNENIYKDIKETKRNATITVLENKNEKNTSFVFIIYFDGITKSQMDTLKWCISLGENKQDSQLCHKIGHGKPLGLGSAKIIVSKVCVRTYDGKSYSVNEKTGDACNGKLLDKEMESNAVKELLKICNFESMNGKKVVYPYITISEDAEKTKPNEKLDNILASHKWFLNNKDRKGQLPKINMKKQELCVYEVVEW